MTKRLIRFAIISTFLSLALTLTVSALYNPTTFYSNRSWTYQYTDAYNQSNNCPNKSPLPVSAEVDKNINLIMDTFHENATKNPQLSASSNPYDYIQNNKNFNDLVNLGTDALPVIAEKIKNSNDDGLKEYILAIAAEKIAKVNLKGDDFGWSTGKDWQNKWAEHLSNVKSNVDDIINSNDSDKISSLEKLGTPAIPFIVDAINNGHKELIPATDYLLEGIGTKNNGDYNEWYNANKNHIAKLRDMVNKPL